MCGSVLLSFVKVPPIFSSISPLFMLPSPPALFFSIISSFPPWLFFLLPSFCPLRSVTVFPRRKSCSEPHLAKMMPLFQNPLGVENTCSSYTGQREIGQIAHFFPCWRWNAHMYPQMRTLSVCTRTHNLSESESKRVWAISLGSFTCRLFIHYLCAMCFQSEVNVWC